MIRRNYVTGKIFFNACLNTLIVCCCCFYLSNMLVCLFAMFPVTVLSSFCLFTEFFCIYPICPKFGCCFFFFFNSCSSVPFLHYPKDESTEENGSWYEKMSKWCLERGEISNLLKVLLFSAVEVE